MRPVRDDVRLSLVIPAYNEAARLAAGFVRLAPSWPDDDDHEVIMVDDGSSDQTMRVAHEVYGSLRHFSLIRHEENQGKGAAVRRGLAQARGRHVIVADADMAIDPHHFATIDHTLEHCAVAPGSRTTGSSIRYDNVTRTLAGRIYHGLVYHYTGLTLRDTQCGCKGFRLGEARLLALLGFVDRFAYDVEMLFIAHQIGITVESVPVSWRDVPGSSVNFGTSTRTTLRDLRGIRHTVYRNPVVRVAPDVAPDEVARAARSVRLSGLVMARSSTATLIVGPRDGAVALVAMAEELSGHVDTVGLDELRHHSFWPV